LGKFWMVLKLKVLVCVFYGPLVCLTPWGIFYGYLVNFGFVW
jgi:hypothetical protein